METGTLEIAEKDAERERRRLGRTGGSSPSSGGGNGGGPNDDDGFPPKKIEYDEPEQPFRPGISRILTGFLLLVVLMTFGGLTAAYVVIATNNVAEWHPFDLPIQVWISTAIIIASSLTYHIAKVAIDRDDQPAAKKWLIVTTVFGAAFISSQLLSWLALTARGLYVQGNPYAGFFFILTAVHAVHVLGGVIALGAILLRTWHPGGNLEHLARRKTLAQVVGWYWHFMGAVWIVLFVLLGFWK